MFSMNSQEMETDGFGRTSESGPSPLLVSAVRGQDVRWAGLPWGWGGELPVFGPFWGGGGGGGQKGSKKPRSARVLLTRNPPIYTVFNRRFFCKNRTPPHFCNFSQNCKKTPYRHRIPAPKPGAFWQKANWDPYVHRSFETLGVLTRMLKTPL